MTQADTEIPFVWDRDHNNFEQVRPYLPAYLAIREEITAAGDYPYNDSFRGRIPGVAGSEHEDTAIYMLNNLTSLDELNAQIAHFINEGGHHINDAPLADDTVYRGTVVTHSFYVGGTGWRQYDNARFTIHHRDTVRGRRTEVLVYPPRKRNPIRLSGDRIMVRVNRPRPA
ncbi:hypothetical protein [Gordonia otitidis]|nr:hypothetical protein [Gordonia otitidis]